MKLVVRSYIKETRRRSWLACQENRRDFEVVKEKRWRIQCGKTILEDDFRSEEAARNILNEEWTYEGLNRGYNRAENEKFEKIQVANEKFEQDVADLNKRLNSLKRLEKKKKR